MVLPVHYRIKVLMANGTDFDFLFCVERHFSFAVSLYHRLPFQVTFFFYVVHLFLYIGPYDV